MPTASALLPLTPQAAQPSAELAELRDDGGLAQQKALPAPCKPPWRRSIQSMTQQLRCRSLSTWCYLSSCAYIPALPQANAHDPRRHALLRRPHCSSLRHPSPHHSQCAWRPRKTLKSADSPASPAPASTSPTTISHAPNRRPNVQLRQLPQCFRCHPSSQLLLTTNRAAVHTSRLCSLASLAAPHPPAYSSPPTTASSLPIAPMNLSPYGSPFSLVYFNAQCSFPRPDQALPVAGAGAGPPRHTTPPYRPLLSSTPSSRQAHAEPLTPRLAGRTSTSPVLRRRAPTASGAAASPSSTTPTARYSLLRSALRPHRPPPSFPTAPSLLRSGLCALVRPKHRAAFLLAVVYLPPQCAKFGRSTSSASLAVTSTPHRRPTRSSTPPHRRRLQLPPCRTGAALWSPKSPPPCPPARMQAGRVDHRLASVHPLQPPRHPHTPSVGQRKRPAVRHRPRPLRPSCPDAAPSRSATPCYLRSDHLPFTVEHGC